MLEIALDLYDLLGFSLSIMLKLNLDVLELIAINVSCIYYRWTPYTMGWCICTLYIHVWNSRKAIYVAFVILLSD